MHNRLDLVGNRFGKVVVIDYGYSMNERSYWLCQCDCGISTFLLGKGLKNGKIKSCGCFKPWGEIDITGQRFGRLIAINKIQTKRNEIKKYNCLCDCGNYKIVTSGRLRRGETKTCGLCPKYDIKYSLEIRAAKDIFHDTYRDATCTFEEFYEICKQDCYYCGCSAKNSNKYESSRKQDYIFYYNGLDRIDNTLGHTKKNCVSCCYNCNIAKDNRNINIYYDHIYKLISTKSYTKNINQERLKWKNKCDSFSFSFAINKKSNSDGLMGLIIKRYNSTYSDGDLTVEQFYTLSQEKCFYCNEVCVNKMNARPGYSTPFTYNSLDRVDPNIVHNFNNLIPACKFCNHAKNNYTLEEFFSWINRLENKKFHDYIENNIMENLLMI